MTMWTRRMGLRAKILVGYGLIVVLLALVFTWAIHNLLQLGRATDNILNENYQSIVAAEHMLDGLERQDSGVLLYLLGFEEEGTRQFQSNERTFYQWLARAKDNITIDGETAHVDEIEERYAAYLDHFTRFMQEGFATGEQPAAQYHDVLLPAFRQVREAITALRDLNQQTMYQASERAQQVATAAIWSTTGVSLLAIMLALAFSLILSGRVVRPLRRMQKAARKVAAGDYEVAVPESSSDELGELARQFNEMTARLQAYRKMNIDEIVAEKRKSEAIVHGIEDGLVAVDSNLRISDINPAASRVLGLATATARGRPFAEVVDDEALIHYVQETVAQGEAAASEEQVFLSMEQDGERRHFQYSASPVETAGAAQRGAIVVLRDVTKLREIDRLKSEFVATASHELKTPLTSIGMSIGLLRERLTEGLGERERELLDVAGEEVQRLRRLVGDLLDLSKIEAGRIEMEFGAVPPALLFEKAAQTLSAQASERCVELIWEADGALPEVRADANKITWVLTNLISNALRYTPEGGHVRLAAEPVGSKVHLSVADDGAGIPYEYQSKIFDKFVQVKGESLAEGSGLGLAICKEIVRAHGGTIWVDSVPGEGSTFTFTLPLA